MFCESIQYLHKKIQLLIIFVLDLWGEEVLDVAEILDFVADDKWNVWRDGEADLSRQRSSLCEEVQVAKQTVRATKPKKKLTEGRKSS